MEINIFILNRFRKKYSTTILVLFEDKNVYELHFKKGILFETIIKTINPKYLLS